MTRTIKFTPISWLSGAAGATGIFGLVWLVSKPNAPLYNVEMLSVAGSWCMCLSALLWLYARRYFSTLWLHGGLVACFWTRIYTDVERKQGWTSDPYGLVKRLMWMVIDLFPLVCLATLATVALVVAVVQARKMYREALGSTQ